MGVDGPLEVVEITQAQATQRSAPTGFANTSASRAQFLCCLCITFIRWFGGPVSIGTSRCCRVRRRARRSPLAEAADAVTSDAALLEASAFRRQWRAAILQNPNPLNLGDG